MLDLELKRAAHRPRSRFATGIVKSHKRKDHKQIDTRCGEEIFQKKSEVRKKFSCEGEVMGALSVQT